MIYFKTQNDSIGTAKTATLYECFWNIQRPENQNQNPKQQPKESYYLSKQIDIQGKLCVIKTKQENLRIYCYHLIQIFFTFQK